MRNSRIFYPHHLITGETVQLGKAKSHYILDVLRLKSNDALTLFNGEGYEHFSVIKSLERHHVFVKVGARQARDVESSLQIHLGQGISRGERMDFVLQKAVELGVQEITPLITKRCNVKLSKERWQKRLKHWQGVVESACEQSGRNILPTIHEPIALFTWLTQTQSDVQLLLSHRATEKLSSIKQAHKAITLLIGPEGGLMADEIDIAIQHKFTAIKMGPRIMRTETAALAAIASLQTLCGDF